MVSTLNLEEKYNKVRRNFCFYLDIQDNGLARSLSRRLQDLGLQQEVFLTSRVTHVVRDGAAGSADAARAGVRRLQGCNTRARTHAMVERARPHPAHTSSSHHVINVRKAISLLDKLYDTFFAAPRRPLVKHFTKHYIKIEFLDKICRPVFKEFDDWPEIPLEPDPPKEKKDKKESTTTATANKTTNDFNQNQQTIGQKMTRKSRPRIKEKDDKEAKGGYCEMCNAQYADAASHRSSPHHLAFVRDHNNFLALDSLIGSGNDVTTFLDKATAINGERRSLRNMCNGELEPKCRRSKRSQSPGNAAGSLSAPPLSTGSGARCGTCATESWSPSAAAPSARSHQVTQQDLSQRHRYQRGAALAAEHVQRRAGAQVPPLQALAVTR
ncbi:hypothetical protein O0L34_g14505 [Tuta absoluta]|nr:hypothetical protein O0L34_g14505 [Tuta absoluta]